MILALLVVCLSFLATTQAGQLLDTAGHSVGLPLRANSPAFAIYEAGDSNLGYPTYFWAMRLDANESYVVNADLCGGQCTVWISQYSGPSSPTNPSNLLLPQSAEGHYSIVFRIPEGQMMQLTVIHEKRVSEFMVIPSVLVIRISNPWLNPPSSTGVAIDWPGGRGPVGLFIEDNLSNAFLPRQEGWSWTEYDRDLTSYTFSVGFVYHLMQYDAFFIEPSFGDATYLSTTLNYSTQASSPTFGTWDAPNTDETTTVNYNFHIPVGGVLRLKLYYIYQIPGQAQRNNMSVNIVVGNSYGLSNSDNPAPNSVINHAKPSPQITLQVDNDSPQFFAPQSVPDVIESTPSNANDASSLMMNALTIVVCAVVAIMSL